MKKYILLTLLSLLSLGSAFAQRKTDALDRGLVAVKTSTGVFVSWRVQAEEYFDVKYNLYRNGSLIAENLNVSNYQDNSGSASSTYTVKAVDKAGVEQAASKAASVWNTVDDNKNAYLSIPMQDIVDRNGNVIYSADGTTRTWDYTLNDASVADIDGDGEMEIIVKRINATDAATAYPNGTAKQLYEASNTTAYTLFEAYKLNGTRLWWIDCGPNMVSLNSTEINIIAYDWDQDGKAEVLMRGADNMIIHMADGTSYNVGDMSVNTRNQINSHTNSQYAWTMTGNEYLIYMEGATAKPYSVIDFPLKRQESGETLAQAWTQGDASKAYGHRSSKYFFGAPHLDGRKPSIFLARGIYTRTKMVALDVNPSTHALTQRWYLDNNTPGSVWYGQGNHNMAIADVDGDGCDEIIYGSMVIDNNGKGLSSTGLGHGDASHTGDLNPYRKGLETFACNEDNPSNNYRDAATCEVFFREDVHYNNEGKAIDDGRCLMDNFSNSIPGSLGRSVQSGVISSVTGKVVPSIDSDGFIEWGDLNWRIYWDGDLCSEYLESPGTEGETVIYKPVSETRLLTAAGTKLNNDTKNNPCFAGDIIGDWREEFIVRSADNKALRIYSTTSPTPWRIPSLWYDAEYRQAMVWQMCAYNQPPHVSYFLGEMEDITEAPVPYTLTGRTEISAANSVISSTSNNKQILVTATGNVGIDTNGASPELLVVNVPSTVSGSHPSTGKGGITYSYASTQLGATINNTNCKGDLTGDMRLVKQGDGLLKMTARTFSYTGETQVWSGSLYFRGTLQNSPLWMNRHTTLYTGGTFKSVTMEYGSTMYICKDNANADGSAPATEYHTAKITDLNMHEGSRIVLDMSDSQSDVFNLTNLSIRKRDWQYGPEYLAPVFQINSTSSLGIGDYLIGTLENVDGDLADVVLECTGFAAGTHQKLVKMDGNLYLRVYDENEDFIGASNNSTAFFTDFSDSYKLPSGWTANFKFTNYGSIDKNWYNWILIAANGTGHTTTDRSDYDEYFALRADNYGWGDEYGTPTLTRADGSDVWASFQNDMAAGADVDMNVTFNNSVVTMNAVITSATGNVYNYTYTSKAIEAEDVYLFFTIEKAHITKPVVSMTPYSNIRMTYVDMDNPTTAYGELNQVRSGYNKISNGSVDFANTSYGVDHIAYIQLDLSSYKGQDVDNITFSFMGSGSTDNKRSTSWGIGYNNSDWSSTMTYNTAEKRITTIGSIQNGGTKSSTAFNPFEWDITSAFNADEDGILTILVYETQAAGGYIKNPSVTVEFTPVIEEDEPTNVITETTKNTIDWIAQNRMSKSGDEITAASNAGNQYALAIADLSNIDGIKQATSVAVEFDVNIASGSRWVVGIGDKSVRGTNANSSNKSSFVTDGLIMRFGTNDGNYYRINGDTNNTAAFGQNVHVTFVLDRKNKTYSYKLTDQSGQTSYFSGSSINTEIDNATIIEAYSWQNNAKATVTSVNVTLTGVPSSLILNPKLNDDYESGIYASVTLNRSFKAGYSTLCVPFNTTVEELTGGDEEAYVAHFSNVEMDESGSNTLIFTNGTEIVANRPYIIYLSKPLEAPVFHNKAVYAENAKSITVGDWTMTGNYEADKSMSGLYGVAKNSSIMKGGSKSTLNGFTAFIQGPALAMVKSRFTNTEDDATGISDMYKKQDIPVVTGIYTIGGIRIPTLQKGINIIRMSDGTVKKHIIK